MSVIHHTFDLDSDPFPGEAFSGWQRAENAVAAVELRPTGRHGRRADVSTQMLGDLRITDWATTDFEGIRTSRMAEADSDAIVLVTVSEGRQIIESEAGTHVLDPGGLALIAVDGPGRIVVPSTLRKRAIRVPMAALTPHDAGRGAPRSVIAAAGENALCTLLHDVVVGIDQLEQDMSPDEVECARSALLTLVAGVLRAHRPVAETDSSALSFLRTRLEASIVERLPAGAVSVGELAATHNVAVRTVQRAFAETGDTVSSVARAHRLAAARSDLVTTSMPIARIAHRWGFCDASHLGRHFRHAFAMSPGDYRDAYGVTGTAKRETDAG